MKSHYAIGIIILTVIVVALNAAFDVIPPIVALALGIGTILLTGFLALIRNMKG